MFEFTIIFLYASAGAAFALSRLPKFAGTSGSLALIAFLFATSGIIWHAFVLFAAVVWPGGTLTMGNTASVIGLQLALIATAGSAVASLRGLAAGLLLLAGIAAFVTEPGTGQAMPHELSWQLRTHILVSLFAYGLLCVGAIVALFALIQDSRLRGAKLSSANALFAPLETNEKLLYSVASAGFLALLIAIVSGFAFVDDLFAQHLVHKSALSILALVLFGTLIIGRQLAGWRGKRAVYLYLWGFAVLCLAYFGSRYVLEIVLGRSWS